MLGTANAACGMLLKWKAQFGCAVVWWRRRLCVPALARSQQVRLRFWWQFFFARLCSGFTDVLRTRGGEAGERHMPELPDLNPVIHGKLRLALLSLLSGVEEAEFTWLRAKTGSTDGNLGAQLMKLEEAGYVAVEEEVCAAQAADALPDDGGGAHGAGRICAGAEAVAGRSDHDRSVIGVGSPRHLRFFVERCAHALHDAEVVGEIVDGVEGCGERFAGLHEMAQIGAASSGGKRGNGRRDRAGTGLQRIVCS